MTTEFWDAPTTRYFIDSVSKRPVRDVVIINTRGHKPVTLRTHYTQELKQLRSREASPRPEDALNQFFRYCYIVTVRDDQLVLVPNIIVYSDPILNANPTMTFQEYFNAKNPAKEPVLAESLD